MSENEPPIQPSSYSSKKGGNFKIIITATSLFLLVVGSLVGLYLTQVNQDLRQQASQYPDVCSGNSASSCQGQAPGSSCGGGSGFCRVLPNQSTPGNMVCTCRVEIPQPTTEPTIGISLPPEPTIGISLPPTETPTPTSINTPTPEPDDSDDSDDSRNDSDEDNSDDSTTADNSSNSSSSSSSSSTASVNIQTEGSNSIGNQPTLPNQLPQTGPEDWLQYLQIGLGAMGIGFLLLLFL